MTQNIEELGGYYILAGGDMKTAVANFHASKTYGDILRRLQLTEAEVKAFTTKDTNPEQYEKIMIYITGCLNAML